MSSTTKLKRKISAAVIDALEARQLMSVVPIMSAVPSVNALANLAGSGTTYYISPTGSDSNNGSSLATAWKTVAAANAHTLSAGDSVLLQGGSTFAGPLSIGSDDVGTANAPITISSFGNGRAIINAGTGDGIKVLDTSGITISNINVIGNGPTQNGSGQDSGIGINVFSDKTNGTKYSDISIDSVDVGGFGFVDIGIGAAQLTSGFANVSITNSVVHNAKECGVYVYSGNHRTNPAPYAMSFSNIYVGHVTAYQIEGYAGNNDSGNGILVSNTNGGTIEYSVAYDNGAKNVSTGGGNCGIWCYNSNNFVIQYNESYGNVSAHIDANGFDLDGGCTNCIMQYNYSHDNYGSGYLLAEFANGQTFSGNIVRYNISQNDARHNNNSAFMVWAAGSNHPITNTEIYGNTIYLTKPANYSPEAFLITTATTNVHVYNNIFAVSPGLNAIVVKAVGSGLVFQGNDYWNGTAGSAGIAWGSANYTTLAAWQAATGQEKLNGVSVGQSINPQWQSPGTAGTLNNAEILSTINSYLLKPTSPLLDAGVNLASMGIKTGNLDYYGNPLPNSSGGYSIGANQYTTTAIQIAPAGNNNSYYLSTSDDGTSLQIWHNTSGSPTQTIALSDLTSLRLTGGTGTTTITLDLSNGNPFANRAAIFDGLAGNASFTVMGSNAGDAVQISGSRLKIGSAAITFANLNSITLNSDGGNDIVTQTAQPTAAFAFNPGSGSDTLNINRGTYTFAPGTSASNLTVNDSSIVQFAAGKSGTRHHRFCIGEPEHRRLCQSRAFRLAITVRSFGVGPRRAVHRRLGQSLERATRPE